MRAHYDSRADAMSIDLVADACWDSCVEIADRVNVAISDGRPVNVELLYPTLGIDDALRAAADRYDLDTEALVATARAAYATPDRSVELRVAR